MKKIILMVSLFVILFSFVVMAQEEHDFTEAEQLVDSGISCSNLANEQLESIGDYFMEQMHPGEAHEYMDRMMGGEGSESLKEVHINIAKRIYCNEDVGGMMGMMGGMMGNYYYPAQQNNSFGFQLFFYILSVLIMVILVLIIILLITKLKRGGKNKHGK